MVAEGGGDREPEPEQWGSPVAVFSGHQNSTFYIKSSTSPDDQFLVSGSSDCNAYIWKGHQPAHKALLPRL
ncbi:hypothetical protein DV515_00004039 [Chloebia gouldiae]|uniref:Uncharacterized protein n=1 Tax=Chloebia gouldiae TaxID=44316 RepID=A0A3L8SSF3_CHLGU|nr:hypothetical protein DV515_00004039 [Chloebia gouldiae]